MDLEAARKALPKRNAFSSKRVAFFVAVGLCVIAGIILRSSPYFTQPQAEQNAPAAVAPSPPPAAATLDVEETEPVPPPQVKQYAPDGVAPSPPPAAATPPAQNAVTAPTEQAEPTGEAVGEPAPAGEADEHAESELPGSGIILVAKQPVEVRASPSSSAPALYGFPAGRPFRVIGREGGFAHIQDLRSSASGWIDEAALARPPRDPAGSAPAPAASAPAQPKPFSVGRKPTNPSAGPSQRRDRRSRPAPKQPLNRIATALAYLVEEVFSGGFSATATRACTHKPTAKCKLGCAAQRPFLGVKRTWRGLVSMSANDPKRTFLTTYFFVAIWRYVQANRGGEHRASDQQQIG